MNKVQMILMIGLLGIMAGVLAEPVDVAGASSRFTVRYFATMHEPQAESLPRPAQPLVTADLSYMSRFWKVYYNSDGTIYGCELFSNQKLVYYYLFTYQGSKTTIRGFYYPGYMESLFLLTRDYILHFNYLFFSYKHCYYIYEMNRMVYVYYYSL